MGVRYPQIRRESFQLPNDPTKRANGSAGAEVSGKPERQHLSRSI